jgi:NhaP-type Na+/H+ or K+/H+ antiporter
MATMAILVAFSVLLLLGVLLSGLANRTILSTAVLFLVGGFVLGNGVTGVIDITTSDPLVANLASIALFAVLFTDGQKVGWGDLTSAWRLPGRALLLGMPLTMVITAVLAYWLVGLSWPEAFLIGAILAPTDPVFAAALVGNNRVPYRLRHLLNVESGLNDGLALPFVVIFLALAGSGHVEFGELALELVGGIALGVVVPWAAIRLEQSRWFNAVHVYEPLNGVAIGLLVFSIGMVTHANLYLAAFAAGITIATIGPKQRHAFEPVGELVSELLKLAALLVFGALISPEFLAEISMSGWVFVLIAFILARPVALAVALWRSGLTRREQVAAMWFGPKGFASVVYGLLVLEAGLAAGDVIFHLVAATIALSIILHSSTDVVVANSFARAAERESERAARERVETAPVEESPG